jgi:hypothetical protein
MQISATLVFRCIWSREIMKNGSNALAQLQEDQLSNVLNRSAYPYKWERELWDCLLANHLEGRADKTHNLKTTQALGAICAYAAAIIVSINRVTWETILSVPWSACWLTDSGSNTRQTADNWLRQIHRQCLPQRSS